MHKTKTCHFALLTMLVTGFSLGGCTYTFDRAETAASCDARSASIYYDEWQYELSSESKKVLNTFQKSYKGCKIDKVEIVGMADSIGDDQENLKVSQQRADVIAAELVTGGWDRSKFNLVAIGKKGAEVDGVKKTMRRRAVISVEASS